MTKFKQNAGIGERIGTVQESFTQNANLPREKAVEVPNSTNSLFGDSNHHSFTSFFDKSNYLLVIIKQIVAFVK